MLGWDTGEWEEQRLGHHWIRGQFCLGASRDRRSLDSPAETLRVDALPHVLSCSDCPTVIIGRCKEQRLALPPILMLEQLQNRTWYDMVGVAQGSASSDLAPAGVEAAFMLELVYRIPHGCCF